MKDALCICLIVAACAFLLGGGCSFKVKVDGTCSEVSHG